MGSSSSWALLFRLRCRKHFVEEFTHYVRFERTGRRRRQHRHRSCRARCHLQWHSIALPSVLPRKLKSLCVLGALSPSEPSTEADCLAGRRRTTPTTTSCVRYFVPQLASEHPLCCP